MALKSYRELDTWQVAMDLVEETYKITRLFPDTEKYGLVSQMQRAAVSIPANVAEGYGRLHRGDYIHHISIAQGSLAELETHLTISIRLGMIPRESAIPCWDLTQRTGHLLRNLQQSLIKPKSITSKPDKHDKPDRPDKP